MTEKNIQNLFKERETVELKASLSLTKEILQSVSAFANTKGGKILIGVDDTGKILGVQIGKGTIENLANGISQNTEPKIHPKISVEEIDGKKIILVEVKESLDKLVLAFGRPYKRVGKSSPRMSKDEYEIRILEKHKEILRFDKQVCEEASLDDLDKKKVNWYLKKREEIRKIKKPKDMSYEKLLTNLEAAAATDGKTVPTNAGVLFFAKNPQRFFVQSPLRVVKFKGTKVFHPTIDRIDCQGALWEMITQAEDFIRKNIRLLSFRTEKSFMREDKFEYPIRALREGMINALIHRDYRETADTRVFIFDDRLEIINPGKFPKDVTPEKPVHKPVNPVLSSLMYDIGDIEKYGSGIYLMRDLCKKWGNKKPRYELHPVETKLIFESPIKESTVIEFEDKVLQGLNERQKKALKYIAKIGEITNRECRKLFPGISDRTVLTDLKDMVKKGILFKEGKTKSAIYRIPK